MVGNWPFKYRTLKRPLLLLQNTYIMKEKEKLIKCILLLFPLYFSGCLGQVKQLKFNPGRACGLQSEIKVAGKCEDCPCSVSFHSTNNSRGKSLHITASREAVGASYDPQRVTV